MEVRRFKLNDFLVGDEVFHIARVKINSKQDLSLHDHDYAEMFWVESGKGTHLINGKKEKLQRGDLVMVRPSDAHTFASTTGGVIIVNLAFDLETLNFIKHRYFPVSETYFWNKSQLPFNISLDDDEIDKISRKAQECMDHKKSTMNLDSMLLFVLDMVQSKREVIQENDTPDWLINGIQRYNTPILFKKGAKGFAELCGKNIDHVNRVVKRRLGKTLSDLVTEQRMKFAATQLIITNSPIKKIGSECGFENLAHFYKVFRKIHHQTPHQFRKAHQTFS